MKPLRDIDFLFRIYIERDRRLFAGFLAKAYGRGGVRKAVKLTGLDVKTVRRGKTEIINRTKFQESRIRRPGSGRPSKTQVDTRYEDELQDLMEDELAGDPMSERKWMRKTLRWIKKELQGKRINTAINAAIFHFSFNRLHILSILSISLIFGRFIYLYIPFSIFLYFHFNLLKVRISYFRLFLKLY
ncbi:MAG: hypothetical protein HWN81_02525 [Candidatus Lokiarchaeota archaeon]|nr:hypothetical protein [Candidatus Lokiarchaeota archaeon]